MYTVNDVPLVQVYEHKYLGLTLTRDFRWNSHIVDNATATARKCLFFLGRYLRLAPPDTKLLAYKTFVRSVF